MHRYGFAGGFHLGGLLARPAWRGPRKAPIVDARLARRLGGHGVPSSAPA